MQEESTNIIFILDSTPLKDPALFEDWYGRMKPARRERIDGFKVEGGKRLSLAAGIILEKAMAEAGIPDYELELRGRGKPYIRGRDDIFFNISHSGDVAVLGLSGRELGVDIERCRTFKDSLKNYVFLPEELDMAKELTTGEGGSADLHMAFTRLWTAKESVMKYSGLGISLEPKKIRLEIPQDTAMSKEKVLIPEFVGKADEKILVTSYYYGENYVMSVCSGADISFSIKEVTI